MRRRHFIILLGAAACAHPVGAHAEASGPVRRIGLLMGSTSSDPQMQSRIAAFTDRLKTLGWSVGGDVEIKVSWYGGSLERAISNATAFADASVDVMVANGTLGVEAARKATRSRPIVFALVGDPVGDGYVQSLAHPGGNITGFSAFEPAIAGKWMELLKEIAPRTSQIVLLSYPGYEFFWSDAKAAAPRLDVKVTEASCNDEGDIKRSISALADTPAAALVVLPAPFFASKRDLITGLAATHRVPAIYPFRYFAHDGGLISYGIDTIDIYRRTAVYVDQILKGAKPADLPVQAPTKFEMVINLNAARAIQLTVPPTLLARADEVIG
jgi:putative ABC transport system substrate-binding protein